MKKHLESMRLSLTLMVLFTALFFTACGDDDDFTPVAKNRGYDYAFTSVDKFAEYPCNEQREGREAVVGRDKDSYYCEFDSRDSVYLWIGDEDTLTATGKEFVREESSSSSDDDASSSRLSSSSYSSGYSSSYGSSSSYNRSSSSRQHIDANPRLTEKGEQFNSAISYGIMTDPRDGTKYKTVVVNGQTWMAENLNYTDNEYGESFCFNDEDDFCELYGRLYTREAAMNSPDCPSGEYCYLGSGPIQGICPDGWHIPTYDETETLINYIGKNESDWASAKGWNLNFFDDTPEDTYGLSFVPGGVHESKGFRSIDTASFMWVYKPNGPQRYFVVNAKTDEVFLHDYTSYVSIAVRCVKGTANPLSSSSYSSSSYRSSSSYSTSSSSQTNVDANPRLTEKGEQFNSGISYGIMTDSRDGKKYKTVAVNGQTWMAENLNFAGNKYGQAFCYNDDEELCDLYGRLYSREAAMNSPGCPSGSNCNLGSEPVQGICPDGWHIPTVAETESLMEYVGKKKADWASEKGWISSLFIIAAKDTYGLSFVPGGLHDEKGFRSLDTAAFMWVYLPNDEQRYFVINGENSEVFIFDYTSYVSVGVRCISGIAKAVALSSSSYTASTWSSESPSSSFSISSKEDLFNPDLTYGTMTDPRDGKTYKTIVFNGQTWMAENLNFADSSIIPLIKGNTQCYHEKASECELFGRLYSREAAMNDSKCAYNYNCDLSSDPVQGICPDGWHMMTYTEANSMINYVGSGNADKIISANGWGSGVYGTNSYGLSFIAPGARDGGNYDSKGGYAYYWLYRASIGQYFLQIKGEKGTITTYYYLNHDLYLPVRCIKD